MEASLVTLFFLMLVVLARCKSGKGFGSLVITRLAEVHRGSLYDMFLGASILCFGIQLATFPPYRGSDGNATLYFLVNDLVSPFAFLPLLALCCLVDATQAGFLYWFFRASTFVLYSVWVVVVWFAVRKHPGLSSIFIFIQPSTERTAVLGELLWEIPSNMRSYCDYQFNASSGYLKLAVVCVWAAMLMPPGIYLIIGTVRLLERLRGSTTYVVSRLTSRFFHFMLPVFCLVGVWTILGLILHIRGVLTAASRDELSTIEINNWEAGQILATLTWIPVVVEMGRIAAGKDLVIPPCSS
ncbi:uncharacterized protein PG986_011180 [Apiospora aurea]|uniref:Uncharacterized protein n=1 Tax=Apiospora aurea TaxID=335848 RepID=A0ABR1Q4A2_9PEZI